MRQKFKIRFSNQLSRSPYIRCDKTINFKQNLIRNNTSMFSWICALGQVHSVWVKKRKSKTRPQFQNSWQLLVHSDYPWKVNRFRRETERVDFPGPKPPNHSIDASHSIAATCFSKNARYWTLFSNNTNSAIRMSSLRHCNIWMVTPLVSFVRAWNIFSNIKNSTIRMYLSRAFIWMVTPLGFICKIMNSLQ